MIDLNPFPPQGETAVQHAAVREDPLAGLIQDMERNGIHLAEVVIPDGKIHRFNPDGKRGDKAGWYVLFVDGDISGGAYGDWRDEFSSHKWCSRDESAMSSEEQRRYHERIKQAQAQRARELEKAQAKAKAEANLIWDAATPAINHPYLMRKGVPAHDLRVNRDGVLIIPIKDYLDDLYSLQYIGPDGNKLFLPGGAIRGNYHTIRGSADIYICEGYATGASIHTATGGTVVVAFNAGNLPPVTEIIKSKFPTARIIICADNDQYKPDKGNPGIKYATEAAEKHGARMVFPTFKDLTTHPTDFNDLMTLEGIDAVKEQIRGSADQNDPWEDQIYTLRDAYAPRAPLEFIVSGLFTLPSLSVMYGAPGTLKSMLLGDMAVCVAAGKSWLSREVIQSPVMWIDLDNGQRRTHERFAALARARSLPDNTPLYYVSMPQPWLNAENRADLDQLTNRIIRHNIKMVCIDNLGLISMSAEEKSDAMIPIMANLRILAENTGAAVVLIHHQRKSTSTSARAGDSLRGHSGIEGALDLALLVTRDECGNWITIQSTKTRDVEVLPFMAEFRYDHVFGTNELQTASFVKIELEDNTSDKAIEKTLLAICKDDPVMTQKKAVALAKKELNAGVNRIRFIYKQLKESNRIVSYSVAEDD